MSRRKSERKSLLKVVGRDQLANAAQAIANDGIKRLPIGARIVVVVTDANGEWVGVGSNTYSGDVAVILESALRGADRRDGRVIDTYGEGAP